ncbi:MAG: large conductance mechanosensitive channel protein MscL [Coriobacteriia bacterium]|nr:large conductance mechanosensitive channel protein MscL [Coriobacteriia bacterium]
MLKEFKEFAFKGNVVDLAIGIVIGAAFSAIVNSFIKDMINPFLGLLGGGKAALEGLSVHLNSAVTLNYGAFLSAVLNFLVVALVLFLVIKGVNRFRKAEEATGRPCPYCLTEIPKAATRCSSCTSEVPAE